ncbi:hypothetical protein MKW94_017657 [Papaver nudicaule]|uniref:Retrotransposon Copia-like N-terminal domain-containing protein n=1 Tax=Papaver nudicaule TaxID=74823 RepID=A0AA41RQ17_PAPNU|nr:hypothetical protein [Papaver nudicaule]
MASASSEESFLPFRIEDVTLTDMINMISFKLDETNYLIWRSIMQSSLESQDMFRYVDPMVPIPPAETLDSITNKLIPNPAYEEWVKTDRYVLSEMERTITEPILSQLSGLKTSRDVYNHLEKSYFDEHSARVPELRHQLLALRKGNLQVENYFTEITRIKNDLWFVGHSVSEDDLVRFALGGLGHEYHDFVQDVLSRPVLPKYFPLRWLLIEQDIMMGIYQVQL